MTDGEISIAQRDNMINILLTAAQQDRTVVEFQNREDGLVAFEITEHVDVLEERVNNGGN